MDDKQIHKTNVAFIVNPISGSSRFIPKRKMLESLVDKTKFDYDIFETKYSGHAVELASSCSKSGYDLVVAVGGDGTVNEVGRGLIHSGVPMGIIPCGSGNGLARHLGIPLDPIRSFRWLQNYHVEDIDYGLLNDKAFFTTCGVGFDALISKKFAESKSRGLMSYVENVLHELLLYHSDSYLLFLDGEVVDMDAFLITCANANQWGNGAYIAPGASVCDGYLDVSAISRFSPFDIPLMAYQLMHKQIDKNPCVFTRKCRELTIRRRGTCVAHYDGDPILTKGDINMRIVPHGLRVAVPTKKRPFRI